MDDGSGKEGASGRVVAQKVLARNRVDSIGADY